MITVYERNARAADYSRRCRHIRRTKKRLASAAVQRALLSSSFLFIVALAAYIITK